MAGKLKIRRQLGHVLAVPLGDQTYGYGRVLREPLIAFYELRSTEILPVEDVLSAPVAFVPFVMNNAVTEGVWPVIGNAPLSSGLLEEPLFYKKDVLSGVLTIYRDSTAEETPATKEQCEKLERAAVWEPDHVVDRLRDHFAGRPNKWVSDLRT